MVQEVEWRSGIILSGHSGLVTTCVGLFVGWESLFEAGVGGERAVREPLWVNKYSF